MNNEELNSLISLANDKLACGPECKKDRETERLREIYNSSKQNLIDAPANFVKAEKNYLINAKGEDEYKNIMRDRTIKTINDMKKNLIDKHNKYVNEIRGHLSQYNTSYIYYNKMDDFYKSNLKNNKKYKKDIGDLKSNVNVKNRKAFYEDEELEGLTFVRIVLLVIYFCVLFAILYKIEFINKQLYYNKYALLVIFIYAIFGIYVDWFTKMIYYMKLKITHIFENDVPRNVYVSI